MKILVMVILLCAFLVLPQLQTEGETVEQYACVKKNHGQYRIVDNPEDCNPSEYSIVIDVDSDSELKGEICWTNSGEDCVLKLKFRSLGTSYSLIGNEICNDGIMTTVKHVYGSGYENNDNELSIGVTYTGLHDDAGIFHEGKVFVMDLDEGFALVKHRESSDLTECGEDPVPCIIQDIYTPVECF
jgi:hypothetical protein